ncbi:hypothetical protein SALBM311S_06156 [Streptomyces alboniger]
MAALFDAERPCQVAYLPVHSVEREGCGARSVAAAVVVLARRAVGRRDVGRHAQLLELLAGGDAALAEVETKEAVTKSGSASRTFSKEGLLSARRGTVALAFSRPFITGSVQVAVPAMRSARPRESRISVVPWLRRRRPASGPTSW